MTTLADIRRKHPGAYDDMDDNQLADALYKKHYSDMDRSQFNTKIGLASQPAQEPKPTPTVMERIAGADLKRRQMMDAAQTGIGQGVSLGFMDEIAGGAAALGALVPGGRSPAEAYRETTDQTRDYVNEQKGRNPVAFTAGEIGGGLATGLSGGARMAGIKGSAGLGAAYGAGTADGGLMDRVKGAGVGALVGAGTHYGTQKLGQGVGKLLQRKPALTAPVPTAKELKGQATAFYNQADRIDEALPVNKLKELQSGVSDALSNPAVGYDESLNSGTAKLFKDLSAKTDSDLHTSYLNSLLKRAKRLEARGGEDGYTAGIIRENIDDFLNSNVPQIAQSRKAGDAAYRRAMGAKTVQKAVDKAERMAAKSGSGGNIDNSLRTYIEQIRGNEKKARFFTADEIAAMDRIIKGTPSGNLMRSIGKFSPETGGLTSMMSVGGAVSPAAPVTVPLNIAGVFAKRGAERSTRQNVNSLLQQILSGQSTAPAPTVASQAAQNPRIQELLARAGAFAALN
jgi:hypothetical protein